jgi:hypothetical protein
MTGKPDCGCGGAGAGVVVQGQKGGCACGDGCGCEPSLRGESFVRPRFFSGMLLTEDDLQGVVDYGVAKRRLTNRYVLGAGVVCGLDVACHPCERDSVRVAPGYAIECCGNDIYVSCPEDVDVIDLVRDLRRRRGVDCGEPCEDQPHQDYYLYVRYRESPTAPVAPYASDECAIGDCEFSRVREGYCFELRCEAPDPEPSMYDAQGACPKSNDTTSENAQKLLKLVRSGEAYSQVAERAAQPEEIPQIPTRSEFEVQLVEDEVELAAAVDLIGRATLTLAMDAASRKGNAPSPRLNAQRREIISTGTRELARKVLDSEAFTAQPPDERARIHHLLITAEDQPDLSETTAMDRAWLVEGQDPYEVERSFVADAELMRGRVLRTLSDQGRTRCQEYRDVSALRFASLHQGSTGDARTLGRAYVRSISDCICAAFHPPCPTCSDNAVLLARVRVEGCDVTDVCSLVRRWVQSPRATSYWVGVDATFGFWGRLCCEDDGRTASDSDAAARAEPAPPDAWSPVEAPRAYAVSALMAGPEGPPETATQVAELAQAVGLSLREPVLARAAAPPAEETIRSLETRIGDLEHRLAELASPGGEEVDG